MNKYLLLLIGLISFVQTQAQQKTTMSLQDCIDYGLKNNLTMQNAKLDMEQAHRKAQEVLGSGLPQVNFSGTLTNNYKLPPFIVPAASFGVPGAASNEYVTAIFGLPISAGAGFSANQLIFDSRYILGVQATRTLATLQAINVTRTEVDMMQQVTKAYYMCLIARENLKMLNANVIRLEKLSSDLEATYKQGLVEQIDVNRIKVNLNNLKTQLENVKKLVELSDLSLKFQMGMSVNDPIQLSDSINSFKVDPTLTDDQKTSYNDRPEYQILQTQLQLNVLDKKQVLGSFLPALYLSAGYGFEFTRLNGVIDENSGKKHYSWYPYQQGTVGLNLQWNLFDGFQKSRQLQQKNIEITKTSNNIKQFEQGAMLEIRSTRSNLSNAISNYRSQKSNVDLAQEVYRQAKIKYDNGVGSSLELTNAQTDLQTAQANYLQAWVDALNAQIDLKKALGLLK